MLSTNKVIRYTPNVNGDGDETNVSEDVETQQLEQEGPSVVNDVGQSSTPSVPKVWPKRNDVIKYLDQSDETWKEVKVLGPAGKRCGGNKSWFNVQNDQNTKYSLDLDSVDDWEVTENNQEVLLAHSEQNDFLTQKWKS